MLTEEESTRVRRASRLPECNVNFQGLTIVIRLVSTYTVING